MTVIVDISFTITALIIVKTAYFYEFLTIMHLLACHMSHLRFFELTRVAGNEGISIYENSLTQSTGQIGPYFS